MSIAKKAYEAAKVGGVASISAADLVSVGSSVGTSGYERLKNEVEALKELERHGKVHIDEIHHESSTGQHYVDHVKFTRLA